jgi:hypothetical protein
MLLRRWQMPVLEAIGKLVGLQAQTPHSWYHGLWTRLEDFQPERLAELLINRQVLRIALMRSTIHFQNTLSEGEFDEKACCNFRRLVCGSDSDLSGNFHQRSAGRRVTGPASPGRAARAASQRPWSRARH